LTATAKDAAGNTTTSTVQVNVSNAATQDTQPPSVAFTTVGAGSTVSGTVGVQIAASDNVGVTSVTLTTDGVTAAGWTSGPYIYTWNTKLVANGTHTLVATAKDSMGNTSTATIQVTVNNTVDATPPTVSIVSPKSGATLTGNSITVQASVYDNVGVVRVELYVNGALMETSFSAPFSINWNSKRLKGNGTLQLKAYDAAGNAGLSPLVSVTF